MLADDDKKDIGIIVADTVKEVLLPTLERMSDDINVLKEDVGVLKHDMNTLKNIQERMEGKLDRLADKQLKLVNDVEEIKAVPVIAHELNKRAA